MNRERAPATSIAFGSRPAAEGLPALAKASRQRPEQGPLPVERPRERRRLSRIAAEPGVSVNALAAIVDASRGEANLSSALRVYVLEASWAPREDPMAAAPQ